MTSEIVDHAAAQSLFVAASARKCQTVAELSESTVALRPMTSGGEMGEDCRHVGLTLRNHPFSCLCADLTRRRTVTCREATQAVMVHGSRP